MKEDLTFDVRLAQESDIVDIVEISGSRLGDSYLSPETVNTAINDDNMIVAVISSQGEIAAFATSMIVDAEYARRDTHGNLPESHLQAEKLAVIKTVAASQKFSGYRVATTLVARLIEELQARGVTAIYSTAWIQSGNVNIGGTLSRNGFWSYAQSDRHWYEDSIREQYTCAECGEPPCCCAAMIFVR